MRQPIGNQFGAAEFQSYLAATFPSADLHRDAIDFGDIHLRFELGDPHPNGSDERVEQAMDRAVTLFREILDGNDELVLIVKRWESSWSQRSSKPGTLFSLIHDFNAKRVAAQIIEVDGDPEADSHEPLLIPTSLLDLDYRGMLQGIAHREQGRTPRILESVYVVNTANNIVYYMYDDRGCLIYSDAPGKLRRLYRRYNAWLVDSTRGHFDAVFRL